MPQPSRALTPRPPLPPPQPFYFESKLDELIASLKDAPVARALVLCSSSATVERVARELEEALQYLLSKREADPYQEVLPRVAVEASWNWDRQVPTFRP